MQKEYCLYSQLFNFFERVDYFRRAVLLKIRSTRSREKQAT